MLFTAITPARIAVSRGPGTRWMKDLHARSPIYRAYQPRSGPGEHRDGSIQRGEQQVGRARDAPPEEGHPPQRRERQEGDEPQPGDRDRPLGGPREGRARSRADLARTSRQRASDLVGQAPQLDRAQEEVGMAAWASKELVHP